MAATAYYLDDQDRKVPFHKKDFSGLVRSGQIRAGTMIWEAGQPSGEWLPAGELHPALFLRGGGIDSSALGPEAEPGISPSGLQRLAEEAGRVRGSVDFSALGLVLLGVFSCFTVVGLPAGTFLIFAGFQLFQAQRTMLGASEAGDEVGYRAGMRSMGLFWKLLSIGTAVGALTVLLVLIAALLLTFDVIELPESWLPEEKDTPSSPQSV